MSKDTNFSIEFSRFVASCGIVWFHVKAPGATFAYGGLPVFMIFSIAFVTTQTGSIKSITIKYFRRLIVPWFLWSAIYASLKIIRAIATSSSISQEFHYWMLLTGASLHLWYLPFAFCSILVTYVMIRKTKIEISASCNYIWLIFGGLLFLGISFIFDSIASIIPLAQWLYILPAIPVGIFFSTIHHNSLFRMFYNDRLWILVLCFLVAFVFDWDFLYQQYIAAVCVCAVAWLYKISSSTILSYLGGLSYGIYLVHAILAPIWIRLGVTPKSYTLLILTIISSIIVVVPLKKVRFGNYGMV